MFSFHKPKIYRSVNGCCICKAKSSSSRFTDSKKYEPEFENCFKITEKRSGEICNACVLLVKRWKKLPPGTNRDWHHVVDARAGPGTKSMMKYKSKSKISKRLSKKSKNKHDTIKRKQLDNPEGLSDDITIGEECLSDQSSSFGPSIPPSLAPSPTPSDVSDDCISSAPVVKVKPRLAKRQKIAIPSKTSSFLDMTFWKKEKICCGIIFKGPNGQVLIDPKLLKPCSWCKKPSPSKDALPASPLKPKHPATTSIIPRPQMLSHGHGSNSKPLLLKKLPAFVEERDEDLDDEDDDILLEDDDDGLVAVRVNGGGKH